jgi:hypothetical protein
MSCYKCPDCGKEYKIFGDSHIDQIARRHNLEILTVLPIDPKLASACDNGKIESFENNWFERIVQILTAKQEEKHQVVYITKEEKGGKTLKIAVASENEKVTEHFGHCINFNIYELLMIRSFIVRPSPIQGISLDFCRFSCTNRESM